MQHGGFMQKKGMFWNGHSMQKAKQGAYDTMWKNGGQFVQIPVPQHMDRYGLNLYKQGGFVEIPVKQEMYRYGLNLYQHGGSVPPTYTAFQPTLDGMYKEGGIHIAENKKGTFTAAATRHGKGVQEFANQVLANKENYSPAMVKKAVFAHNVAGWKKQYGGPMYDNGGTFLPAANNPWGSANTNTDTQMQEVYAPVQQANADVMQVDANSYANRPRVTTDQLSGPTDSGTNPNYQVSPYAPNPINEQEEEDNTVMKQRRPFGTGYRNLLGAAMMYGQYAADKRQQKSMQAYGIQQGMTQMNPNPTPFSRGTYNQQGQMMKGKYGGQMQYRMGGVYEVDDNTLAGLKMGGYKFKMV
jgi:hypothetical protein